MRARDAAPTPEPKAKAPAEAGKPATDETDFKDLMLGTEGVPVTSEMDPAPAPPDRRLLKLDGTMVVNRRGTISRMDAGWCRVTFLPEADLPAEPPRWILPNRLLESVEPLLARTPPPTFRISGETTAYRQQLFLILRKVIVQVSSSPSASPSPPSKSGPTTRPAAPATPAPAPGKPSPAGKGATSEDIFQQLMKDRPGKPVIAPLARPREELEPVPSVAPGEKERVLPAVQGKVYIGRIVRTLPVGVGAWQEVRFEADNTLQEPPMRILPNQQLQRAVSLSGGGRHKIRITGEATQYRGRRYILLRKVMRVRDMNQF